MAWTLPTAVFFLTIASLLTLMTLWEFISPGGAPRTGVLRFETLPDNHSMQKLGLKFGFVVIKGEDPGILNMQLQLSYPHAQN